MHPWILGLWLGSAPASDWQLVERVVAVVDDDIVLASELDRRVAIARAGIARLPDPAERQRHEANLLRELLQTIVDERLIARHAAHLGLTIEDSQVDGAIAHIKAANNNLDDATFTRAIADSGLTMAEYRADLHNQLLRFRLFTVLFADRLKVSDAAVQAAHAAEKTTNPALGELTAESERIRAALMDRIMNEEAARWLTEARRTAHVELRP